MYRQREHVRMLKRRRKHLETILEDYQGADPSWTIKELDALVWAVDTLEALLSENVEDVKEVTSGRSV